MPLNLHIDLNVVDLEIWNHIFKIFKILNQNEFF